MDAGVVSWPVGLAVVHCSGVSDASVDLDSTGTLVAWEQHLSQLEHVLLTDIDHNSHSSGRTLIITWWCWLFDCDF